VKTTAYFDAVRVRPDRSAILDEWIERAIQEPFRDLLKQTESARSKNEQYLIQIKIDGAKEK